MPSVILMKFSVIENSLKIQIYKYNLLSILPANSETQKSSKIYLKMIKIKLWLICRLKYAQIN